MNTEELLLNTKANKLSFKILRIATTKQRVQEKASN